MSLKNLITLPNKNLRIKSSKVTLIDSTLLDLINQMEVATLEWEASREHEVGVALAAVQIDSLTRVIVIRNNFEDKSDQTFQIFINPEITKFEGTFEEDYEGCLSIKDIYGKVPRYTKVRVKALNIEGKEVRVKADGFLARVFQHEIDHTNGIVFIDHIKDNTDAFFELTDTGKLEPLDYKEVVKNSKTLWPS